ncbi:MAG: flagellar hook-associated protein FlgL, partial [Pseudomonadota bacterium]|nr:flagellar hook-associated protein FlgL [Pseudomonadota bacterium]
MPISTRLFNDQAITRFNRITSDIQQTQDKIATGKKVLKASDDPVAAATISFVRDQKVMLDRFATNIDRAQTRLTLTENVVAESVNLLTRAYELGIQAKNDTLTAVDRRAISFEISQIRESMMSLANSKDVNGNYLFAGYRTNIQPFVSNEAGEVTFAGDRGVHSVQISDSLRANTGLDGADVFMRVDIDGTTKPFFDVLTSMERELQGGTINNDTVAELNACIDHFAVNQTRVGAELNKLDYQKSAMERRVLLM